MGLLGRKVTIEDGPAGLVVKVPVRDMGCAAIFMAFWLIPWAVGEFAVFMALAEMGLALNAESAFFVAWLLGWSLGGGTVVIVLVRALAGREVLTLTGTELTSRNEALGIGRTTSYDLRWVRHLRAEKGSLLFHYDETNVIVGRSLKTEETAEVLAAMLAKRPELGRDWHAPIEEG